jgi:hypothetical protein
MEAAATGGPKAEKISPKGDGLPRLSLRKGRQAILQILQAARHFRSKQIGTRGQHLADFDGAGTNPFESLGEALARQQRFELAVARAAEHAGEKTEPGRSEMRIFVRHQRIMGGEDARDVEQPPEVTQRTEHEGSQLPGRMHGGDAAGEIAMLHLREAGARDALGELRL